MEEKGGEKGRGEPGDELNQLSRAVIGAAIEVHRCLGPGFLESSYQRALCVELGLRGVRYAAEHSVGLLYKGHEIGEGRLDLLVDERLVVELKAVERLTSLHEAQVIFYLKATGLHLGLLINFNCEVLYQGVQRVVLS